MSLHKSLDAIESSYIIKKFTIDNLFFKEALELLFKLSNFVPVPGLISKSEWMVTGGIIVGLSRRTLGFSGSSKWQSNVFDIVLYITFIKWDIPVSPLPEKIYVLVKHNVHHILHNF